MITEYVESYTNLNPNVSFTSANADHENIIDANIEEYTMISMQLPKPILITPYKVMTCARPFFKLTPSKRSNISPTKAQLKNKIKLLQQQIRRKKSQ